MQCLEYWEKSITHDIVLFQQCCYGYWGQLLTTPSFEAGSALLYNPRFYWSLHYQYDVQPKEWCCLLSDNCDLYYRVRPLDRCFGYRFPWFSEYSMMVMMTRTIIIIMIMIMIIIMLLNDDTDRVPVSLRLDCSICVAHTCRCGSSHGRCLEATRPDLQSNPYQKTVPWRLIFRSLSSAGILASSLYRPD